VGHRKVEPRLPWIPLTARTATWLIIDTTRFVTLSTSNVQSATFLNGFTFLFSVRLSLREDLGPHLFIFLRMLFRIKTPAIHFSNGRELRVTTKNDVCTATGHVRRNGHRTRSTRIGNNGSLASIIFS